MLGEIEEKVRHGVRITPEEGLFLFRYPDVKPIEELADMARFAKCGNTVYFASTLFIHPTNLCELSCPLCSFYAKPGWKSAWFQTPSQIEETIRQHLDSNLTEIHVVGGLWRDCNLDYFEELFQRIKSCDPRLHIKALTPVEYDFLSRLHDISVEKVFEKMMGFGLGSLPGGGAEVLVEKVRKQIAPQKITSDRYLEIHRIAHQLGLRSNITMLYGHVEDEEDLITHLCKVRQLQDETKGFATFVPLEYHDENNALGKRKGRLKPKNRSRVYALSRLMLDNVRNLKVLWNYVGVQEAQRMLSCGANDFASTSVEEKIIQMAGGVKLKMTRELISSYIEEVGRTPLEINSGHEDAAWVH